MMMPRDARPRSSYDSRHVHPLRSIEKERAPIDLYPRIGDERWSDSSLARVTWAFVGLGVIIRLVRLLLVHPLWGDECYVAANLIGRGYSGLLRPLDYQQICPVLFLWVELSVVKVLGFSEWSLRVFPTACGIAALFVFRHLAGRLMRGLPLLMSVAIVAVALNPIRHSGEVKPYASDFLVSACLLAIVVEWWRRPDRAAWLWALAAATPLAIGLSLPSAFVIGGIGLALSGPVHRARRSQVTAAYVAFNAAIVAGFLASWKIYGAVQSTETRAFMDHYWSAMFPPLRDPIRLLPWLLRSFTGQLFAYPVGGAKGASILTVVCVVAGLLDFWRRGRSTIVFACLAPLGLALVASSFRFYPFGESERLMQFEGPMICLLAGHGLAGLLGRFRRPGWYRPMAVACLLGFALIGVGAIVADLLHPARTTYDLRTREFARWFWLDVGRDAEVACSRADLGLDFEPGPMHHGRSADYLCYQKIFSSRHRRGMPLDWSRVSLARPLRCVLYDGVPIDSPLFARWMGLMSEHYRLSWTETYRANAEVAPKGVTYEDHLAVLEFVPKGEPVDPIRLARIASATDLETEPGPMELSDSRGSLLR